MYVYHFEAFRESVGAVRRSSTEYREMKPIHLTFVQILGVKSWIHGIISSINKPSRAADDGKCARRSKEDPIRDLETPVDNMSNSRILASPRFAYPDLVFRRRGKSDFRRGIVS